MAGANGNQQLSNMKAKTYFLAACFILLGAFVLVILRNENTVDDSFKAQGRNIISDADYKYTRYNNHNNRTNERSSQPIVGENHKIELCEIIEAANISEEKKILRSLRKLFKIDNLYAIQYVLNHASGLKRNLLLGDLCNLINDEDHEYLIKQLMSSSVISDQGYVGVLLDPSNPSLTIEQAISLYSGMTKDNVISKGQLMSYVANLMIKNNEFTKAFHVFEKLNIRDEDLSYVRKELLMAAVLENPEQLVKNIQFVNENYPQPELVESMRQLGLRNGSKFVHDIANDARRNSFSQIYESYLSGWLVADTKNALNWISALEEGDLKNRSRSVVEAHFTRLGKIDKAKKWSQDK